MVIFWYGAKIQTYKCRDICNRGKFFQTMKLVRGWRPVLITFETLKGWLYYFHTIPMQCLNFGAKLQKYNCIIYFMYNFCIKISFNPQTEKLFCDWQRCSKKLMSLLPKISANEREKIDKNLESSCDRWETHAISSYKKRY